jgi:hypothetical protein
MELYAPRIEPPHAVACAESGNGTCTRALGLAFIRMSLLRMRVYRADFRRMETLVSCAGMRRRKMLLRFEKILPHVAVGTM